MAPQEETPEQDLEQELKKLIPWAKSWRMLYIMVLAELGILILFFLWFSRAYL